MARRILLFGKNGQVGWELNRMLLALGEVIALDVPEVDFSRPESLRTVVREHQPDMIVNAAAYTAVDKAEEEPDLAMAVNGIAPGVLAEEARRLKACFVHYSTDYVFDGEKGEPYTEQDEPDPINTYGKTKLAGEQAVQAVGEAYLIFRTSWVYSLRRECFVTKVLRWAREQETLRIVDEQIGSPTWCRTLAELTFGVLAKADAGGYDWLCERAGIYHVAGKGAASRYEMAQAILQIAPEKGALRVKDILPVKSVDFPAPARRPKNSSLGSEKFSKVFGLEISNWQQSLALALIAG
jgi:dTDP-4-dehydrorhamnose reductase